jgi:hypothetical protein
MLTDEMLRVQEQIIEQMSLDELREFVAVYPEQAKKYVGCIRSRLAIFADDIGGMWDKTTGTDPAEQRRNLYITMPGTRNHQSMTYKFRKLAGYTYP